MDGRLLELTRSWILGDPINAGGFGEIYTVVADDGTNAVAKFVPKIAGAKRELLLGDSLSGARNVVPIIDSGADGEMWVMVMPRADGSLRDHIAGRASSMAIEECLNILGDIVDALIDLADRVVHRDLKPENVLSLGGHWCLADFGISRYAEASTALDTRKFSLSPPYAAPEQWRNEHATIAADMYALGVMGYEMLAGHRPFPDGSREEWRDAHLHLDPPQLESAPTALATLIDECMYKAPETRPSPANFRARLDRCRTKVVESVGLEKLQEANRAEVQRRAAAARLASEAQTEEERRSALFTTATRSVTRISVHLRDQILESAPAAVLAEGNGWSIRLNDATLTFAAVDSKLSPPTWGGWQEPAFDVVAVTSIAVTARQNRFGYTGRSHSLWFGDIQEADDYAWYETAFMEAPLQTTERRQAPFALQPGKDAAQAVWIGLQNFEVAWPFTRLEPDDLDDFVSRWAGWLADAANGSLYRPSTMPEQDPRGTWRP